MHLSSAVRRERFEAAEVSSLWALKSKSSKESLCVSVLKGTRKRRQKNLLLNHFQSQMYSM